MKRFILILGILTLAILNCKSQINPGFENWTTQYTYEIPDNWQTLNFLSTMGNPLSAFKATGVDKHSGNYALKLKTVYLNNNPFPGTLRDTIGYAFTGKVTISPPTLKYGYQFTGRPEKMEFYAKYQPVGSDTAGGVVLLTKWDGIKHDTIAYGDVKIPATAAYTLFQINIIYNSTEIPDSALIAFASSYKKSISRVNSTLFVDDLAFTGWVGINEPKHDIENVKVFPNPVRDGVTILAQIKEADNVQILDAAGRLSGTYKIENFTAKIDTNLLSDGTYFYNIRDKKGLILSKGKFSVCQLSGVS